MQQLEALRMLMDYYNKPTYKLVYYAEDAVSKKWIFLDECGDFDKLTSFKT